MSKLHCLRSCKNLACREETHRVGQINGEPIFGIRLRSGRQTKSSYINEKQMQI